MNPKINGLMSDALHQVLSGAARTAHSSDAKRPARQGSPSCESLEGRVVLSNFGGADLLGSLSQIGVVTTVMDAGGPRGGQTQAEASGAQTSQTDTDWQTLQAKIQGLAAKSEVTIADLSALSSDSRAIATGGGGLKVESLQTVLGSLATAVAGGADTTQAQTDFNALFSGSKVDQTTIDKTFTDLVQTIKDSKITATDLTDFATAQAAITHGATGSTTMPGFPGAPGWINGAGPGGDALTASLANAGVTALPSAQQATAVTTASAALPAGRQVTSTTAGPAGGTQSNQLQTDLDKLRTDQQAVTAKSAVTSDDLDQLKTDSQNITTAGFNFDPKTLQATINSLVAAVAGGTATTQAQSDFNALFSKSSVSQAVVDKTFTDLVQTIQDSKITAADATLIVADQTAVQADFAALPKGGMLNPVGPGGMVGGFGGQGGGFGGPGGMVGGFAGRGGRGGMVGGFGGGMVVSQSNQGGAGGPGGQMTASAHTTASSGDPGAPTGTVSVSSGAAVPTTSSETVATPASTDPGATTSATVGGGRVRGDARGHFARNMAGGRVGRNAAGGSERGVQDLASGMNPRDRAMSRFRRR